MKNTICAIPWVHLNIIPKGKVYPCCMTTDFTGYAGDLNTQTIEEVWNSDYMKKIRVQMINGEEPKMCSRCFEGERSSGQSSRRNHNNYFKSKLEEIPIITREDGHVEEVDLRYWDFRFSNLCNYKCRSCGPEYSSSWIPDSKELGWIQTDDKVISINAVDDSTNVEFLKKYIDKVEKVYFAGGEPLLMDEHWQILEMLDEAKRYDVIITYNTNVSKLTYKSKNAIDYWKKWGRNIWLWPSIDEVDERAELIRSGTVWSNVEDNLKEVLKLDIHLKPSPTVSVFNVFRLPEIVQRMIDIGVIRESDEYYNNFSFNVLEFPHYYHVSVLPFEYRLEIKQKLEKFIEDFNSKYNTDIRYKFLHLFWHLEKPQNENAVQLFIKTTRQLDEIRGEDTFEIIPELKRLL